MWIGSAEMQPRKLTGLRVDRKYTRKHWKRKALVTRVILEQVGIDAIDFKRFISPLREPI